MANVLNGNTWFVDTSSASNDATTYLSKQCSVVGLTLYVNATSDVVKVYDKNSGQAGALSQKMELMSSTAKNSVFFSLTDAPIRFPNGIWITLTGSPKITFVLNGDVR